MEKILTVVGARPQFVKAAPLVAALRPRFRHILLHTGQHCDDAMSGSFFRDLGIPKPQIHLGISGGSHGAMTGAMIASIETHLRRARPSLVVVLGDTNSTLAAALAAAKLNIPVAHVEAGLRSFDRRMPEEVNRRVTDHVSTLLFCPTPLAARNLSREGIRQGVEVVGDVMCDVLRRMRPAAEWALKSMDLPDAYDFLTIHRQENVDDRSRLSLILKAVGELPRKVIFSVHPRTRRRLAEFKLRLPRNVSALEPVGYVQSLALIIGSTAVLTDSGGLQKEAFLLGRPCVTLRDSTEWIETLRGRANRLVGARPEAIAQAIDDIARRPPTIQPGEIYGDGHTSERIAQFLFDHLRGSASGR